MTDLLNLAPAQRGPVQRTIPTGATNRAGAEQSWAGPGVDWFPFEGGADQSMYGYGWNYPFEGGADQSWWERFPQPFEGE